MKTFCLTKTLDQAMISRLDMTSHDKHMAGQGIQWKSEVLH